MTAVMPPTVLGLVGDRIKSGEHSHQTNNTNYVRRGATRIA